VVFVYAIGAYALPEAWSEAIVTKDGITFAAVICFACVVALFFTAPGILAGKDAHDKYSQALEYDKYTRQDDAQSYIDQNGQRKPGVLYRMMDNGPKGPGYYKQVGDKLTLIDRMTEGEIRQREIENAGGFSGYNEAVNEGRR
jgi:hypothetical protein